MTRGLGEFQEGQSEKERNAEIVRLATQQGNPMSYEAIGKQFGLTKQRVGQIVKRERDREATVEKIPS